MKQFGSVLRSSTKTLLALLVFLVIAVACNSGGPTYNLEEVQTIAKVGMTEAALIKEVGPPSVVKAFGDDRALHYTSKDGESTLIMSIKGGLVAEIIRN